MLARLFSTGRVQRRMRSIAYGICGLALILTGRSVLAQSWAMPQAPTEPHAPLATTAEDWKLTGTQPGGLNANPLISSENCTACHVEHITTNFAGSMMANSARDPLFRAALVIANQDAVQGGELCIRCHLPNAWLNGRSTPSNGSIFTAQDMEGVTCSVCHRMLHGYAIPGEAPQDAIERKFIKDQQGTLIEGSSAYILDRNDVRRGPYAVDAFHETAQSAYLHSAELCANCHEIDNPILTYNAASEEFELNVMNKPASPGDKLFPLERTYSEWRFSDFNPANGGVTELSSRYPGIKRVGGTEDSPVTVCQDCHMPTVVAPMAWAGADRVLGKHIWAGGSAVWQQGIAAFWNGVDADTSFNNAATLDARVQGQAQLQRAADLKLTRSGSQLTVQIINQTGHKLPTGYAEGRRMWLQVIARDRDHQTLYASGVPQDGQIVDPVKVYEIKQGVSPAQAQAINRPDIVAGATFHFILNNQIVKDNRIPPRGFNNAIAQTRSMQPVGTTYADNQYWDTTVYTLPAGTAEVEVTLFYQSASGEYLDFLEESANVPVADAIVGTPVNWGKVVGDLRAAYELDKPVIMVRATLANKVFLPALEE